MVKYLSEPVRSSTLAVFRILFGCVLMYATLAFVAGGWVETYYIEPEFHFKYFGFEFISTLGNYIYILYSLIFIGALGITLGYYYRVSTIVFFLSFTYCALLDKTYYLNHYYFVSLVGLLLMFLPANAYFSLDAKRNPKVYYSEIPRYNIFCLKLLLTLVYLYAGLAKVNSDWLLNAMPLQIWLPSKEHIPILGGLFQNEWMHYVMSWGGMFYDLSVPFLLWYKRTRAIGFVLVIIFHLLTRILFPIGIFPYVMIFSILIFFDSNFHDTVLLRLRQLFLTNYKVPDSRIKIWIPSLKNRLVSFVLCGFLIIQIVFPFRYLLYPDELFWTEEGYRFSWRVMLTEKGGFVQYKVVNPENGKWFYVDHSEFLTPYQEKKLRTQADFILEFAHFLDEHYKSQGISDPEIYVDSYIALNGRLSQRFIDPNVDLSEVEDSWKHKNWILPFNEKIYGF